MAATTTKSPGARATAKYLHVSPFKVRQVLELVRGMPVDDAERVLQLCQKDAADDVLKVLMSASANAEHNHQLPPDELFVAKCFADEGPTRKWGQARARGRYFRIRKRTTHLTIVLERFEVDELEERRRRDEVSGKGAAVVQRRRAERVRRSRAAQDETEADATEASAADDEPVDETAVEEIEAVETTVETTDETTDDGEPEGEEA